MITPLEDVEHFVLLCNDAWLYQIHHYSSLTGNHIQLEQDTIRSATADSYDTYGECQVVSDETLLIFSWDTVSWNEGRRAWFIDLKSFKTRYSLNNYMGYSQKHQLIFASYDWYDTIGFYPLYTTEQLIQKAKDYLQMQ